MEVGLNKKIAPHELAFDVDGVFADTFRSFVETARRDYGVQVEYEDITDYDYRSVIDIDDDTSYKISKKIVDNPIEMGIRPIMGAVDVLTRLSEIVPLFFVTARPRRDTIFKWIQQHLRSVDANAICLAATGTHEEKIPVLLEHGFRYFVEDRLETCYLLAEARVTPIVFEQPWNQKPHPFQTVKSWNEISSLIDWHMQERGGRKCF
jgi:uncharacterized HAD superfamily protein